MAIFGDRHAIERELRDYHRYERNPQIGVRITAWIELSGLYYRIRDYKKAVEYYEEILKEYRRVLERQTIPEAKQAVRRELNLHYYNAACSNSLLGDLDKAKEYLRKAVEGDPVHYDNIPKDGDLRRLREHPSYETYYRELGELFEGEEL